MNNVQTIPGKGFSSNNLFVGSSTQTSYIWKNLVIEKRISMNWAHKLFKDSIFYAFLTVWASPVN